MLVKVFAVKKPMEKPESRLEAFQPMPMPVVEFAQ
jgi:hypothetical protein